MSLKTWLAARRERRRDQRRKNGYDCAAGDLLRGVPPSVIESYIDNPFDGQDDFDRGAQAALFDWERLQSIKQSTETHL